MRLRQTLQRKVIQELDQSRFSAADFTIEFPDSGEILVKITFKLQPDFSLTLSRGDDGFKLVECPSDFYFSAHQTRYNKNDLIESIRAWAEQIYDELRAMTPLYDEFEELREELEKKLNQHVADTSSHFTEEEADQIRKKIGEFDKVLEEYAVAHADLQKQIALLRRDLTRATETIESFSKATWYRTTFNKVVSGLKALGKSPEARQLAADSVKRLVFRSITGIDSDN